MAPALQDGEKEIYGNTFDEQQMKVMICIILLVIMVGLVAGKYSICDIRTTYIRTTYNIYAAKQMYASSWSSSKPGLVAGAAACLPYPQAQTGNRGDRGEVGRGTIGKRNCIVMYILSKGNCTVMYILSK